MSGFVSTTSGAFANLLARVLRRVAVVSEGPDRRAHRLHGGMELVQLILGQGFGREHVQRPRFRVGHQPAQHRQVVAQRLSAGGRRDHDDILALLERFEGLRLVHVQPLDAALAPAPRRSTAGTAAGISAYSPSRAGRMRMARIGESGSCMPGGQFINGSLQPRAAPQSERVVRLRILKTEREVHLFALSLPETSVAVSAPARK